MGYGRIIHSMINTLDNYDWQEAFAYAGEGEVVPKDEEYRWGYHGGQNIKPAIPDSDISLEPFGREDVRALFEYYEGCNDEESWLAFGELNDGRFFYLEAWCDYTGWD